MTMVWRRIDGVTWPANTDVWDRKGILIVTDGQRVSKATFFAPIGEQPYFMGNNFGVINGATHFMEIEPPESEEQQK